jgi:predicted HicB family RNase H-like nuclease
MYQKTGLFEHEWPSRGRGERMSLRMPPTAKKMAREIAKKEGITITHLIETLIRHQHAMGQEL